MTPSLAAEVARLATFVRDWGERSAVIGGIGIIVRVAPRFTDDLDLLLVVPPERQRELLELARALEIEDRLKAFLG